MKKLIVLGILALAAYPAGSSKIIGNGGDVVVCPDRTPRVQLLDFVESRVLRRRSIFLWNPKSATYLSKLEEISNNIALRFPVMGENLKREIQDFEDKNAKEDDIELEDINDSYHKVNLPGCHVEQIANQSVPLFEDDPWVLINNRLWTQLEEFDKAGLVLHEVLYRIGLRHGVEHSIGIRYLVSLFFQEKIMAVPDRSWIEAFLHSRIKYFEVGSMRFPLFKGTEKACEVVPGTIACAGGDAEFKPANIVFNTNRSIDQVIFESSGPDAIDFKNDGYIARLTTQKFTFDYSNARPDFIAEGRLQLIKAGLSDTLFADVRGKFSPSTGDFVGEYRFSRPDLSVDNEWISFNGHLRDLYARRPEWTHVRRRQPR